MGYGDFRTGRLGRRSFGIDVPVGGRLGLLMSPMEAGTGALTGIFDEKGLQRVGSRVAPAGVRGNSVSFTMSIERVSRRLFLTRSADAALAAPLFWTAAMRAAMPQPAAATPVEKDL